MLNKPVPLPLLNACVQEALAEAVAPAGASWPLSQVTADDRHGAAIAALHRLAHSLKTVLQLRSEDDGSGQARRPESAAAGGGGQAALAPLWNALRRALLAQN